MLTVSFGIQKGGVGKTTATAITAWLLSRRGLRVLAVDLDFQGNLMMLLSQRPLRTLEGRMCYEVLKEGNPEKNIAVLTDTLHIIPADDMLSAFAGSPETLRHALSPLQGSYDRVLLYLPLSFFCHALRACSL